MKFAVTITLILVSVFSLNAQDTSFIPPAQVTLVYPIGTHGIAAINRTNNFSLNIFAGVNGGVEGLEVGGFSNVLKNDMLGLQVAGFCNTVRGKTDGIQLAGFSNVTKGKVQGLQGAGYFNVTGGDVFGGQIAGFANVARGKVDGLQVAGFSNAAKGKLQGIQIAGFANAAKSSQYSSQLAGFVNVLAGPDTTMGIQAAGFSNIVGGHFQGAQLSGFLNVANVVSGTQVGFINYAKDYEVGIPIGFLSYVKEGYHAFELSTNELLWARFAFKTGVDKFYNIFSVAYIPEPGGWAFGYGVGSMHRISDKWNIGAEITTHQVEENGLWSDAINLLTTFEPRLAYKPTKILTIAAGPTVNYQVHDLFTFSDGAYNSELAPYTALGYTGTEIQHRVWFGGQLSLEVNF